MVILQESLGLQQEVDLQQTEQQLEEEVIVKLYTQEEKEELVLEQHEVIIQTEVQEQHQGQIQEAAQE